MSILYASMMMNRAQACMFTLWFNLYVFVRFPPVLVVEGYRFIRYRLKLF